MYQARFERGVCIECLLCYDACPNDNIVSNYGLPGQGADNTCTGCKYCMDACPTKACQIIYDPHLEEKVWSKAKVDDVRYKAETGKSQIMSCGTQDKATLFDKIVFVPGQLSRPPLLSDEKVNTSVTIGKNCKKPVTIETPIIIGAMSFGALSKSAKIALARGTRLSGSMANTGEGGMLPEERAEAKNLVVQYSTGKYGITEEVLRSGDMIEIKIGQGAKPGMGGHLLKGKITPEIAKVRGIKLGVDCISPSRHIGINTVKDLQNLVNRLRDTTGGVPIAIKIAAGHVEADLEYAMAAGPDVIMIDGMEGGTGAAPIVASDQAGIPTLFAIRRAVDYLGSDKKNITLGIGGGLRDASDFAKAIALGADLVYIGTAALLPLGCRLCRTCQKGTCPVGIATQNERLEMRLNIEDRANQLANYIKASTNELATIARLIGKDDVSKLDINDLRALDELTSKVTGIKLVYEDDKTICSGGGC